MPRHNTERSTKAPIDNRSADKDELAELRDRLGALETEVQHLRAERDGQRLPEDARERASVAEVVETTPLRDRDDALDVHAVSREASVVDAVSRRHLFGLLGGAAAAGAGLAVASSTVGADRADAADHQALMIGETNSNDNPGGATILNGSTPDFGVMFTASNTATAGSGVFGQSTSGNGVAGGSTSGTGVNGSSTSGVGVFGSSGSDIGVVGNGADHGVFGFTSHGIGVGGVSSIGNSLNAGAPSETSDGAHLRLDPASIAGPPTDGAHTLGQFWLDSAGKLWQCVVAGTPGTWVRQSPLVALNPPARVYDSRKTGGPIGTDQTRAVTVAGLLGIPAGVSAVLTNLTATGADAPGFLAMFAHGAAPPSTSNLNLIAGQDLANNATSAVASDQVDVLCGGPVTSVNFIVDVFGYYP